MVVRILVLVFALLAAGAAGLIVLKLRQDEAAQPEPVAAAPEQIPTTEVLVASADIAAGDVLAPTKLRWQAWPEDALVEGYLTRSERPGALAELSGSFLNQGFAAGEPIRLDRVSDANVNLLSAKLSPGKRAVALKISAQNTAGGFIMPGDRVDVMHTVTGTTAEGMPIERRSRIIVLNVRVLAIDQTDEQNPDGNVVGETATLELDPRQAELVAAGESTGMLSLVLRAVSDHVEEVVEEVERTRTVRIHRGGETATVTLR